MKKIFSIKSSEMLTKNQMRQIAGASSRNAPSSPQGHSSSLLLAMSGCSGAMCCWNNDRENCSVCVEGLTPETGYCQSGAFIAACGDCTM